MNMKFTEGERKYNPDENQITKIIPDSSDPLQISSASEYVQPFYSDS